MSYQAGGYAGNFIGRRGLRRKALGNLGVKLQAAEGYRVLGTNHGVGGRIGLKSKPIAPEARGLEQSPQLPEAMRVWV